MTRGRAYLAALLTLAALSLPGAGAAQEFSFSLGDDGSITARTIQLFALITVLSLAPGLAIMVTCFPFIVTVLSILRQPIWLPPSRPNMLIVRLAPFLSHFIRAPVLTLAWETGIEPQTRAATHA